jgi:hypothetical protein
VARYGWIDTVEEIKKKWDGKNEERLFFYFLCKSKIETPEMCRLSIT